MSRDDDHHDEGDRQVDDQAERLGDRQGEPREVDLRDQVGVEDQAVGAQSCTAWEKKSQGTMPATTKTAIGKPLGGRA